MAPTRKNSRPEMETRDSSWGVHRFENKFEHEPNNSIIAQSDTLMAVKPVENWQKIIAKISLAFLPYNFLSYS